MEKHRVEPGDTANEPGCNLLLKFGLLLSLTFAFLLSLKILSAPSVMQ